MKRGCFGSSESALRNSWMHDTSELSLTTTFGQTEANRASLETGSPARASNSLKTAAAFGVSLTSSVPAQSRPLAGSNRKGPKLTLFGMTKLASPTSQQPFAREIPAKSRLSPGTPAPG
jgi:hypothetical protein